MGGLGNQFFQYAFAKAYSMKNNCEVLFDLSAYNLNDGQQKYYIFMEQNIPYVLDRFNTKVKTASLEQCNAIKNFTKKSSVPKVFRKLFKIPMNQHPFIIKERNGSGTYDSYLMRYRKNAYMIGYFQTEKYFKKLRQALLDDLSVVEELNDANKSMLEQINSSNSVSLHVRRGDYLKLGGLHRVCSLEYFTQSISYISEHIDSPHFYIFSHDMTWAKENLVIKHPHTFVDINPIEKWFPDLELMKSCKHNIVANSSFSWWSAWLNQNPQKIVIAPRPWFNDDGKMKDIVPREWISISK